MIEMTKIGDYIKNSKKSNIILDRSIYSQYNDFNYNDKDIFKIDVDFMLDVYNIQLMKSSKIRSNQDTFRNKLFLTKYCPGELAILLIRKGLS